MTNFAHPHHRLLCVLLLVAGGCMTSVESVTSYAIGGSTVSLPLEGWSPATGPVRVAAISSLDRAVTDPAATWSPTNIAYPDAGHPYKSGDYTYYPWSAPVSGLGSSVWPNGGVARLRIMYNVGTSDYFGTTFDDLSCLFTTPGDFAQRASACQSHVSGHLYLVDEAPVPGATVDYLSARATPAAGNAYYLGIDPLGEKTTLDDWKDLNGFGTGAVGYESIVNARYFNAQDLELGRDMNCRKKLTTNDLACYVTNYGDPVLGPAPGDDPIAAVTAAVSRDPAGLLATVAMEYRPSLASNKITFYVFDADGVRQDEVELDSEGPKDVPGVCLSCHGGTLALGNITGAHFLPFDLQNFEYKAQGGFRRSDLEDEFRALNRLVSLAAPTQAITDQLNGWYNYNFGSGGPSQNDDYLPSGWSSEAVLYREVARPYCRGCHMALTEVKTNAIDFDRSSDVVGYAPTIQTRACDAPDMPHAEVTRRKFWASPARGHLIGALDLATSCKGN